MKKLLISIVILAIFNSNFLFPCTNFLVTKGASADGSTMLTYTADAGGFMEPLYFHPGGKQDTTQLLDIYE